MSVAFLPAFSVPYFFVRFPRYCASFRVKSWVTFDSFALQIPPVSLNYHPVFDGNIVDNPALANCLPNSAGSLIDTFADIDTIGKVRQGMRRLWLPSLDWRREFGSRTKLGEEVGSECTRSAAS